MINDQQLCEHARQVRTRAYAPYSQFAVGAALVTLDDRIFCGVNVENASYGLTLCAERVAVVQAITAGCHQFAAIAVATEGAYAPCGACRQVLSEFSPNLRVILCDPTPESPYHVWSLEQLLPSAFSPATWKGPLGR